MVNAPAEGQAVAAWWCPPGGVVLQLLSLLQVSLKCKAFQHVSARPRAGTFVTIQTDTWGKLGISPKNTDLAQPYPYLGLMLIKGLYFQELLFSPKTTPVASQRSVRANHAVTGDHNCNLIASICARNSAAGRGLANRLGKLTIATRFSGGDVAEGFPNGFCKISAVQDNVQIKFRQLTGKIGPELQIDQLGKLRCAKGNAPLKKGKHLF